MREHRIGRADSAAADQQERSAANLPYKNEDVVAKFLDLLHRAEGTRYLDARPCVCKWHETDAEGHADVTDDGRIDIRVDINVGDVIVVVTVTINPTRTMIWSSPLMA
jgi:hypothetical protein